MSAAHAAAPPARNFETARHFLKCLDPSATEFTFQTFDDVEIVEGDTKKKRGRADLAHVLHGALEQHAQTLLALNAQGAGVFVTINRTDLKGRKTGNIVDVRGIWHDDDTGVDGRIFPLQPHLKIETSPKKFQCYWFTEGLTPADHAAIMETMVARYGSDPGAKDLARVLRLPGFLHMKGVPHLVRIVGGEMQGNGLGLGLEGRGTPYSRDEILKAFPSTVRELPAQIATSAGQVVGELDSSHAVKSATEYLQAKAPLAIQGQAGDDTAIKVANRVFDRGVSPDTALALMLEHWNKRCLPPWDEDELELKVQNARKYRQDPVGRDNGTAHFDASEAPQLPATTSRLTTPLADIAERPQLFTFHPYMPAGELTTLAGKGGVGKGLVATGFAATLTRGDFWPTSQERAAAGSVLWCEAEDSFEHVIKPRFIAAGADISRVEVIDAQKYLHLDLAAYVRANNTRLIVFSPLMSFLKGLKDINSELEGRRALEQLRDAIQGTDCAALALAHLNKKADLAAVERVLGSVVFTNFVRSVLMAVPENTDTGLVRLMHAKHNLSKRGRDLFYTPQSTEPDNKTSQRVRVQWSIPDGNADVDSAYDRKKKKEKPTARDWLAKFLQEHGETFKSNVIIAGASAGYTESAIEAAHNSDQRFKSRQAGFPAKAIWSVG